MIIYAQVLAVINANDDPAGALRAFVEQEHEVAYHRGWEDRDNVRPYGEGLR